MEAIDNKYVNLGYSYQTVNLVCDNQTIPFRYIVKDSVIEKYLIKGTDHPVTAYD